jgi:hypothetical protein
MSNKNLFQEAIADAKAVREAALANAKAALEEALTPKLQSMIAARLEEDYGIEGEEEENYEGEMEEGFATSHGDDSDENLDFNLEEKSLYTDEEPFNDESGTEQGYSKTYFGKKVAKLEPGHSDPYMDEELDLAEILAELELDEEYSLEEAKEAKEDEADEKEGETKKGKKDDEIEMPDNVKDLTALVIDLIRQEMPTEQAPEEGGEEGGEEMSSEEEVTIDEEINLEELLAELDALEEEDIEEEAMMYERRKSKSKHEKEETAKEEKEEHASGKEKKEMEEALSVIKTLRSELNEVNLLNAKLLYVNKIFKAKNLSESQKLQVIASFDKATTAKEAKIVYESLNATLTTSTAKKQIKESFGFASKAAGIAPQKQQIVESNDAITRMQKLANIIK